MREIEQQEILDVLSELEGQILIVEGKKDSRALQELGMGNIVQVNSRTMSKVTDDAVFLMEKHKNTQVIILTDFDRTGRRMAAKIRLLLQSRKIHANSRIRRDVMNLGIRYIEEMASMPGMPGTFLEGRISRKSSVSRIAKSRERDDYGETSANFHEVRGKSIHKGKGNNRKTRHYRGDIRSD
jgi:5S rRNA maturation endonuclease (ribonuclease M5)